ncbi:NO-inducible flavohemoprotein [Teichococcus aerofrigidensis]
MPTPLSDSTIALVKASVPALEAKGLEITRTMYGRMFQDPAIRDLFNQSHHGGTGAQPRALAAAVLAYAQNIDNLGVLLPAVERIAQKHVALNILPEHYPAVGTALLGAIQEVLGEAATPEIIAAWSEAYWFLAEVLIGREAEVYRAQAAARGGWNGWRDFRIAEKVRESEVITSFHLRPVDGGPVMRHRPGEYLTFWLNLPDHAPLKRNYSISAAPSGEGYRISVKREPQGVVSNWLHDTAQVGTVLKTAAPAGDFVLADSQRPALFLSGGVGQTPLLSMLEDLLARRPEARAHWVHGTQSGATHAFGPHLRSLAARHPGLALDVFYEAPRPQDVQGRDHDHAGLPDAAWLLGETAAREAEIYLCGPRPFLRHFVGGLMRAGVPAERLHYEFFGPADELLAA